MEIAVSPVRVSLCLLAANTAMALLFLIIASRTWIEPELANIPGASGGAGLVWLLSAGPILVVAALFNVGAIVWFWYAHIRTGKWPANRIAWLILLLWIAALMLDNSRHGA